jgi:hypothetical protein
LVAIAVLGSKDSIHLLRSRKALRGIGFSKAYTLYQGMQVQLVSGPQVSSVGAVGYITYSHYTTLQQGFIGSMAGSVLLGFAVVIAVLGHLLQKGYQTCTLRYHTFHVRQLQVAVGIHPARAQYTVIVHHSTTGGLLMHCGYSAVIGSCYHSTFGQPVQPVMYAGSRQ